MKKPSKTDDRNWTLEEQIAFECALAQDDREDWKTLKARDRDLEFPEGLWSANDRRAIAKRWLRQRQEREPSIKLAADSISQSIGVAGQLLGALGWLMGVTLATAALAYTGSAPINVSAFFCVFVLLQAVFACLLLVPFLLPRGGKEAVFSSGLFRFTRFVFGVAFEKIQALTNRFLAGKQRHQAAEIAAAARSRLSLHQGVLKWVAFRKLQATALFFNIGALLALLAAVVFSDRAFGWQTTLHVTTESIHNIVSFFASPWAWLYGEGVGYPSPEQIEGSRIVLKEGIQSLNTTDLAAWWRFLALGIVVYGILPRFVFWLLGRLQTRSALRRYDFRNASAHRLFERLRPEDQRFEVEAVDQGSPENPEEQEAIRRDGLGSKQRIHCQFSRELAETFDVEALRAALARRWKAPESNIEMQACEGGEYFAAPADAGSEIQYALVFESWMPPIKEIERQIRSLRSRVDERNLIKVVLLGIPETDGPAISLHPAVQYRETWDAFVRRQGDPYLILDNPA